MPNKPLLQHVTQNSRGDARSTSVTITELDGSALAHPMYDGDGDVVASPVSSDSNGLLEVYSSISRRVLATPAGATEAIVSVFAPDPGAGPLYATDLAPVGVDLTLGVVSASAYINLALAAAAASGRVLELGAGTFNITTHLTVPGNAVMRGSGEGTILRHGDNVNDGVIVMVAGDNGHISDFVIDGNYENNHGASLGFQSAEVFIDGDNTMSRVRLENFNCLGIACGGTAKLIDVDVVGIAADTYPPTSGSKDSRSVYGILTSQDAVCEGITLERCRVSGTRSAGIYVGGKNAKWIDCKVWDCHRGYYPDPGPGGGQTAIPATTLAGGGAEVGTNIQITNLWVGPSPDAPSACGIEINTGASVSLTNLIIDGVEPGGPVNLTAGVVVGNAARIRMQGGQVKSCAIGYAATSATDLEIDGVNFLSNTMGVNIGTGVDYWRIANNGFKSNTQDYTNTSAGTHWEAMGNQSDNTSNVVPTRIAEGLTVDKPTGNVTVKGALSVGNQSSLKVATVPFFGQTVTNGNLLDLGVIFGLATVYDRTNGLMAVVMLRGATGAVVAMSASTSGFTINSDTGTDIAIYYSTGYKVKNKSGADRLIDVSFEGF